MRIAYSPQIFQDQKHGGISRYFAHLCQELDWAGETVAIMAPGVGNAYLEGLDSSLMLQSPILNWIDRYPKGIKHRTRWLRERIVSRKFRHWKPDVVHESYYSFKPCAPAGLPTVLTVYDMIHELFPEQFHPADPTHLAKKMAVERADHVICISESTRRDLIRILNVPEERTSVVYLATAVPSLPEASSERTEMAFSAQPYVLFVGQRGGYKNFKCLLKAYSVSPRLRGEVKIVAFGQPFEKEELRMIADLGLAQNEVEHQGGGDDALDSAYRRASAFVCPSFYEGFGLPVLEAMARGCPVIASLTSSLPEVAGQAAMLFDPDDTEDLRASMETVIFDEMCRASLVAEGFQQAERFSWQKCALETRAIYQKFAR